MPNDNNGSINLGAAAINPEDDVVLQAIEAIEARSVDLDPEPFIRDPNAPKRVVEAKPPVVASPKPQVTVAQPPKPAIVPRVAQRVAATAIAAPRAAHTTQIIPPVAVTPPTLPKQPVAPKQVEKPKPIPIDVVPPVKPAAPKKPAEAIAEALANAPETTPYQPFVHQKIPAKTLITIAIVVGVIILLAAGTFFFLQTL